MFIQEIMELVGKERKKKQREKTAKMLAAGIVGAATIGVAAGILMAPQSGSNTRRDIKKKAEDAADHTKAILSHTVTELNEKTAKASKEISDAISDVNQKRRAVSGDLKSGKHKIAKDIDFTVGKIYDDISQTEK